MTHLSKDQMSRLLELAKVRDVRLYAMILLGFRHGLRASEICGLKVRNFDMVGGYLTLQRLKRSLRTTQKLFPDELAILPRFLDGKGPNDFLFPGRKQGRPLSYWAFWDNVHKLATSLGLPWHLGKTHVIKHSTGHIVIKNGIEFARQYLGHRVIASTGAYLRIDDDMASEAAMAAFGD